MVLEALVLGLWAARCVDLWVAPGHVPLGQVDLVGRLVLAGPAAQEAQVGLEDLEALEVPADPAVKLDLEVGLEVQADLVARPDRVARGPAEGPQVQEELRCQEPAPPHPLALMDHPLTMVPSYQVTLAYIPSYERIFLAYSVLFVHSFVFLPQVLKFQMKI